MRCKKIFELTFACIALLCIACTLEGMAKEKSEPECMNNLVIITAEEPAEPDTEPVPAFDVEIKTEEIEGSQIGIFLSSEDREILMKIAMAEAEGESTEGKALVILSVLNRMKSDEFPDTVAEVVFQDRQYSPVADGRYYTSVPDDDCLAALELVEAGWDESQGAMYFENYGADSWHSRNLEFLFQEGNHKFYR